MIHFEVHFHTGCQTEQNHYHAPAKHQRLQEKIRDHRYLHGYPPHQTQATGQGKGPGPVHGPERQASLKQWPVRFPPKAKPGHQRYQSNACKQQQSRNKIVTERRPLQRSGREGKSTATRVHDHTHSGWNSAYPQAKQEYLQSPKGFGMSFWILCLHNGQYFGKSALITRQNQ